jgi:hypothetical protein
MTAESKPKNEGNLKTVKTPTIGIPGIRKRNI